MSRLSKWLRRVRLGPIVEWAVRWAEKLLGAGTGELKKELVTKIMAIVVEILKKAGKEVSDNADELVDELTEQTVATLNSTGVFKKSEATVNVDFEATERRVVAEIGGTPPSAEPTRRRGGRPKGSKNKPKPDVRGVGPVVLPEPMFEPEQLPVIEVDDDLDGIDLTEFDLDDE